MEDNKRKKLHEYLVNKGIDNKSYEEFDANFSGNEDKQRKLHEYLVNKGIDDKDFETFRNNFFGDTKPKEQPQPVKKKDLPFPSATTSSLAEDVEPIQDVTGVGQQQEIPQDLLNPKIRNLGRELKATESDMFALNADIYAKEQAAKDESLTQEQRSQAKAQAANLKARRAELTDKSLNLKAKMAAEVNKEEVTPEYSRTYAKELEVVAKETLGEIALIKDQLDELSENKDEAQKSYYLIAKANEKEPTWEEQVDWGDETFAPYGQETKDIPKPPSIEDVRPEDLDDIEIREFKEKFEKLKAVNQKIEQTRGEDGSIPEEVYNEYLEIKDFAEEYEQRQEQFNRFMDIANTNMSLQENIDLYLKSAVPEEESAIDIQLVGEQAFEGLNITNNNPIAFMRALSLNKLSKDELLKARNTKMRFPELESVLGVNIDMTKEELLNQRGFSLEFDKKLSEVDLSARESIINSFKNMKNQIPRAFTAIETGAMVLPEFFSREISQEIKNPKAFGAGLLLLSGLKENAPKLANWLDQTADNLQERRRMGQAYMELIGGTSRPTITLDDMLESKGILDMIKNASAYAFEGAMGLFPSIIAFGSTGGYGLFPMFVGEAAAAIDRGDAQRQTVGNFTHRQYRDILENSDTDLLPAIYFGGLQAAGETFFMRSFIKSLDAKALSGDLLEVLKTFYLVKPSQMTPLNIFEVGMDKSLEAYGASGGDMDAFGEAFAEYMTSKEALEVGVQTFMGASAFGGITASGKMIFADKTAGAKSANIYEIEQELKKLSEKANMLENDAMQIAEFNKVQDQIEIARKVHKEARQDLQKYLEEKGKQLIPNNYVLGEEIEMLANINHEAQEIADKIDQAQSIENEQVKRNVVDMYQKQFNELARKRRELVEQMEKVKQAQDQLAAEEAPTLEQAQEEIAAQEEAAPVAEEAPVVEEVQSEEDVSIGDIPELQSVDATTKALEGLGEKDLSDIDSVADSIEDVVFNEKISAFNSIINKLDIPENIKSIIYKYFGFKDGQFIGGDMVDKFLKATNFDRIKRLLLDFGKEGIKSKYREYSNEFSVELDRLNEELNTYIQDVIDSEQNDTPPPKPPTENIGKIMEVVFNIQNEYTDAVKNIPEDIYSPKFISEAYHKAKEDGTNPELVKAIEGLFFKQTPKDQQTAPSTLADQVERTLPPIEQMTPQQKQEVIESVEKQLTEDQLAVMSEFDFTPQEQLEQYAEFIEQANNQAAIEQEMLEDLINLNRAQARRLQEQELELTKNFIGSEENDRAYMNAFIHHNLGQKIRIEDIHEYGDYNWFKGDRRAAWVASRLITKDKTKAMPLDSGILEQMSDEYGSPITGTDVWEYVQDYMINTHLYTKKGYGEMLNSIEEENLSKTAEDAMQVYEEFKNNPEADKHIDEAVEKRIINQHQADVIKAYLNEIREATPKDADQAATPSTPKPTQAVERSVEKQETKPDTKQQLEEAKARLKESFNKMKRHGIVFDQAQQAKDNVEFIKNLAEVVKLSGLVAFDKVKAFVKETMGEVDDIYIRAAMRLSENKPTPRERMIYQMADAVEASEAQTERPKKIQAMKPFAINKAKMGKYSLEDYKQDLQDVGVKMSEDEAKKAYKAALTSNKATSNLYNRQRLLDKIEGLKRKHQEYKDKISENEQTRRNFKEQIDNLLASAKANGYVTANEAISISRQAAKVNTELQLEQFTDRVDRILAKAETKEQQKEAAKVKKAVRKSKNIPVAFNDAVVAFRSINPNNVTDLQEYIDTGKALADAINPKLSADKKLPVSEVNRMIDALKGDVVENKSKAIAKSYDISQDEAKKLLDDYANENLDGFVERQARKLLKDKGEEVTDQSLTEAMQEVELLMRSKMKEKDAQKEVFRNEMMEDAEMSRDALVEDGVIDEVFSNLRFDLLPTNVLLDVKGLFDTLVNEPTSEKYSLGEYEQWARAHEAYNKLGGEVRIKDYKGKTKQPFSRGLLDLNMYLQSIVVDQYQDAPTLSQILGWRFLRETTKNSDIEIHENVVKRFNNIVRKLKKKHGKDVNSIKGSAATMVYAIFEQKEEALSNKEHTEKVITNLVDQYNMVQEVQSVPHKWKAQNEALKEILPSLGVEFKDGKAEKTDRVPKTIDGALSAISKAFPYAKELANASSEVHKPYKPEVENFHRLYLGQEARTVEGNYNSILTRQIKDLSKTEQDQIELFRPSAEQIFRTRSVKPKETQGIHFGRTENRQMKGKVFDLDFYAIQQAHLSDAIREMRTRPAATRFMAAMNNAEFFESELRGNKSVYGEIKRLAENFFTSSELTPEERKKMTAFDKVAIKNLRSLRNKATRLVLFTGRQFFIQLVPQTAVNILSTVALPQITNRAKGVTKGDVYKAMLSTSYKAMSDKKFRDRVIGALGKDKRSYVETHIRAVSEDRNFLGVKNRFDTSKFSEITEKYDNIFSLPLRFGDSVTVQHGALLFAAAEAARQGDKGLENLDTWTPNERQIEFAHQMARGIFSADVQRELAPVFKPDTVIKMFTNDVLGFLLKYPLNKVFEFAKQVSNAMDVTEKNGYSKQDVDTAKKQLTFNLSTWAMETAGYAYTSSYIWPIIIDKIASPAAQVTIVPALRAAVQAFHDEDHEKYERNRDIVMDALEEMQMRKGFWGKVVTSTLPIIGDPIVAGLNRANHMRLSFFSDDATSWAEHKAMNRELISVFQGGQRMFDGFGAYGVALSRAWEGAKMIYNAKYGVWETSGGFIYALDEEGQLIAMMIGSLDLFTSIFPAANLGGMTQMTTREMKRFMRQDKLYDNLEMLVASKYMNDSEKEKEDALDGVKSFIDMSRTPTTMERKLSKVEGSIEKMALEDYFEALYKNTIENILNADVVTEDIDKTTYLSNVIDNNQFIRYNKLDRMLNKFTSRLRETRDAREAHELQAEYLYDIARKDEIIKRNNGESGAMTELQLVIARYAKMKEFGMRDADAVLEAYYLKVGKEALKAAGYKGSLNRQDVDEKQLRQFIEDKGGEQKIAEQFNSFFAEKGVPAQVEFLLERLN